MNIDPAFAFHETGHLVVGLKLGLLEQGIVFFPLPPGEGAQATYTFQSSETSLVRCFAGIITHSRLLPESLEPHLRQAYDHSVIFEPDHPHFHDLTDDERNFLSGAHTDLLLARAFAEKLAGDNPQQVIPLMRAAETQARELITKSADAIRVVAADIIAFGHEPEADNPHFVLYSAERAKQLLQDM